MQEDVKLCVFNKDCSLLAVAVGGNEVGVWEAETGQLKERITTQGSVARCVAWSKPPQKRRRSRSSHVLLAVGSGSSVSIWNITKGSQERAVTPQHSDVITCLEWGLGNTLLYGGSGDKQVVVWSASSGEVQRKWRADKHAVHALCCHDSEELLLTAGRSIKLWNLSDHSLIEKFTGHSTQVSSLAFVDQSKFLSCAAKDRIVNLWAMGTSDRHSVAALSCEEEVQTLAVNYDPSQETVQVVAVSTEGSLYLFDCATDATGSVSATSTVQFVSKATELATPSPLPVLGACFVSGESMRVAHSSQVQPCFEDIEFTQSKARVCLVREHRGGLLLGRKGRSTAEAAGAEGQVTVLGPGNMTLATSSAHHPRPRPQKKDDEEELPLSSRLAPGPTPRPSAESLSQLLVQAVRSSDRKLLEEALRVTKETVVMATVRRLPVSLVIPFLQQLVHILESSPTRGLELSVWLHAVLVTHTAYLMTVPQVVGYLSAVYQLMDARVATFSTLCQLQGKLDLLLSQSDPPPAPAPALATPSAGGALLSLSLGEEHSSSSSWSEDDSSSVSSDEEGGDGGTAMQTDNH